MAKPICSMTRFVLTLGRDPGSKLYISDRKASRAHARIEKRNNGYYLVDTSTNGTFVNFAGQQEVLVRQHEILMQGSGIICFGASIKDPKADQATSNTCKRKQAIFRWPALAAWNGYYLAPAWASATHFFTKLLRAAPASFFSLAVDSQAVTSGPLASAWHFFIKLFLAAPASFFSARGQRNHLQRKQKKRPSREQAG